MAAIALTASVLLLLAVLLAGTAGLVVNALLASAVALGAVRARLGTDVRPASPQQPRLWPLEPFHAYREIQFVLGWGQGRASRPVLARVAAAVLAQQHSIGVDRDPDAVRRLLGEHAWVLADRESSGNGDPDSRSLADIARFVDRLEAL
jgi:hypothetical protein